MCTGGGRRPVFVHFSNARAETGTRSWGSGQDTEVSRMSNMIGRV